MKHDSTQLARDYRHHRMYSSRDGRHVYEGPHFLQEGYDVPYFDVSLMLWRLRRVEELLARWVRLVDPSLEPRPGNAKVSFHRTCSFIVLFKSISAIYYL